MINAYTDYQIPPSLNVLLQIAKILQVDVKDSITDKNEIYQEWDKNFIIA